MSNAKAVVSKELGRCRIRRVPARVLSRDFWDGMRRTTENVGIDGVPARIRTGRLSCYCTNLSAAYVSMYVCVCVCVCARARARACVCMYIYIYICMSVCILEVCHPRCVCVNWKGYVVKHNYVN